MTRTNADTVDVRIRPGGRVLLRAIERLEVGSRMPGTLVLVSLGVLVAIWVGAGLAENAFSVSNCHEPSCDAPHDFANSVLLLGTPIAGQLFLLCLAAWLALKSQRGRRRALALRLEGRLRTVEEWYANGRLDKVDFERFRGLARPLADGSDAAFALRRRGAVLLGVGSVAASLALAVAGILAGLEWSFWGYGREWLIVIPALDLLALAALAVVALPAGLALRRHGNSRLAAVVGETDEHHERLLHAVSVATLQPTPHRARRR